jgi:hypothetical protein
LNKGFTATQFATITETGSDKYKIGDKMKTSITDIENLKSQYKDGFPLPKPDSFGICNNYDSAHFMKDDETSCKQVISMTETECTSVLNAEYYATKLKYYMGKSASFSDQLPIEIGDIYFYDDQTSEFPTITKQAEGTSITSSFAGSGECTCSNYLKEVHYDVILSSTESTAIGSDEEKYFAPTKITANVILDSNPVTGTCDEKIGVNQKFSITFSSVADGETYQKKSGNPGYLDGLPVKLGYNQNSVDCSSEDCPK